MEDSTSRASNGHTIRTTAVVFLIIFGCLAAMVLGADRLCYAALTRKLPIYPGATIVWEGHNLIATFGMGETIMELESPDDPLDVHEWYNRYSASLLREHANDPLLHIGNARWDVNRLDSGPGSQIILHGVCAQ